MGTPHCGNVPSMKTPRIPLLGLCPIGKFVFSHEDALRFKRLLEERLRAWGFPYAGLDGVLKDGIVRGTADVAPAVAHLRSKGVDAVFMPHCNFGTEHAVGLIGRDLGVPALLWAPRDEAPLPDGRRLRDSLCGLFASTKVLRTLGVPFTTIGNCRIDEAPLQEGVDRFLRAVNAAKCLRTGLRIGHVGQRIDFFWSTIIDEADLLRRFRIEVLPLDMVEFLRECRGYVRERGGSYREELAELRKRIDFEGYPDDGPIVNILAVRDGLRAARERHGLDAMAVQTFMSIVDEMGSYACLASCLLGDELTVGMESDIHGTVSNVLLQKASFDASPAWLADLTVRHPANDNGVLLWHSDAPLSLCHPAVRPRMGTHWILPSPLSGMSHFRLRDGDITVARFDGDRGIYRLAVGEGRSIEGPYTQNNYVWMEVADWPRWERKFLHGPFIHHVAMNYGRTAAALREACRYVPGLEAEPLDDAGASSSEGA